MSKPYSPRTARTEQAVCSLRRDNVSYGDFWVMVDESTVTIAKQTPGHTAENMVTVDKETFNKMLRFYNTPSQTRAKKWRLP